MNTTYSIPQALNRLSGNLSALGFVKIHYRILADPDQPAANHLVSLVNVNGYTSLAGYSGIVESSRKEFGRRFRKLLQETRPELQGRLIKDALARLGRLGRATRPFAAYTGTPGDESHPASLRCFANPLFRSDDGSLPGTCQKEQLARLTMAHAGFWYRSIGELKDELSALYTLLESAGLPELMRYGKGHENKIQLNSSVKLMAAFGQMMYDIRVIETRNKSQLCRLIARKFATTRQNNISAEKFRQHFENPDPEVIEQLYVNLSKWTQNFRKHLM